MSSLETSNLDNSLKKFKSFDDIQKEENDGSEKKEQNNPDFGAVTTDEKRGRSSSVSDSGIGASSDGTGRSNDSDTNPSSNLIIPPFEEENELDEAFAARSAAATGDMALSSASESAAYTNAEERKKELLRISSADDDDVRIAKAMALAIQSNPNLTADQIKQLTTSQRESFVGDAGVVSPGSSAASSLLIPGRLNELLKQQQQFEQAQMDAPLSPNSKDKKFKPPNLKSFSQSFKSTTQTYKGKFFDMAGVSAKATKPATPNPIQTSVKSYFATSSKGLNKQDSTEQSSTIDTSSTIVQQLQAPDLDDLQPTATNTTTTTTTTTTIATSTTTSLETDTDTATFKRSSSLVEESEKDKDKIKEPPIRLTDVVWKRRGGIGKYSTSSAWERRRMVLRGTKIYYYRTDSEAAEEESGIKNTTNLDISPTISKDTADIDLSALQAPSTNAKPSSTTASSGVMGNMPRLTMKLDSTYLKQNFLEVVSGFGMTDNEDPNAPRGYLDLVKEKATVAATSGHSGAPSPFAISIKVKGETKWKLCFQYHRTQMEWLAALSDVVVQNSCDSYNKELVHSSDPSHDSILDLFQPVHVSQPPADGDNKATGNAMRSSSVHSTNQPRRLWLLEPYSIHGQHGKEELQDDDEKTDEGTVGASSVMEEITLDEPPSSPFIDAVASRGDKRGLSGIGPEQIQMLLSSLQDDTVSISIKSLYLIAGLWNLSLFLSRASSTSIDGFWFLIAFSNLALYMCQDVRILGLRLQDLVDVSSLFQEKAIVEPTSILRTPAGKLPVVSHTPAKQALLEDTMGVASSQKTKELPGTPMVEGFKPIAGTSAMQIENPTDLPVNKDNHVFAGWRIPSPAVFQVRSHGYMSTKKKIPSPGALYKCAQVDVFESPTQYPNMARRVQLPKVEFNDSNCPKTWKCPDVFVISVALPTDPPKLGRTTSDGGGYTITMYFTMEQETRDILKRVTADGYDPSKEITGEGADIQKSKVNAVRLFEEWCKKAPADPKWFSRFKLIPNVENLAEIGMPQWIAKYNGKPVLIKRPGQTGFFYDHTIDGTQPTCIEFGVSFHVFPYLAKQAICYMKDHFFKKVLMSWGFVIEGRDDDELPECLLGVSQLCYPNPINAIQAGDFFAGACPRSF